ncbi:hypothetical protein pdul_cds_84 [Pandoravirus dulcis]|uniref:Uncharacterized protein n=1 Tax=Pandoravirus dulcis TaxID=1349409 RepID=S4VNZ2_9VIRU|nr:hypothetical protein pdul_cds_84 [Pandoravirus dulcis]AGO81978.1 hypothetical protein pdul_cds_84 [Pandoravirus dulcis]
MDARESPSMRPHTGIDSGDAVLFFFCETATLRKKGDATQTRANSNVAVRVKPNDQGLWPAIGQSTVGKCRLRVIARP